MVPNTERGVFRGKEFSRLIVLLGILVIGWPIVLWNMPPRQAPVPPPNVAQVAPLPPPDNSIEFRGIQDKLPFSSRETPAYKILAERARNATPETLENVARRDVVFSQLVEDPARYRGIPIQIVGTVRRVLSQEATDSKVFPKGRFYEGFVFTPDSQSYPYGIVFENPPRDLLIGDNINQRIIFNGYFFKLNAYRAADKLRFMPMLVGRFPQASATGGAAEAPVFEAFYQKLRKQGTTWVLIALSVYFAIRVGFTLRKTMFPKSTLATSIRSQTLPKDHIEPDALADFLGGASAGENQGEGDETPEG